MVSQSCGLLGDTPTLGPKMKGPSVRERTEGPSAARIPTVRQPAAISKRLSTSFIRPRLSPDLLDGNFSSERGAIGHLRGYLKHVFFEGGHAADEQYFVHGVRGACLPVGYVKEAS